MTIRQDCVTRHRSILLLKRIYTENESYENVEITRKDGTTKKKKIFVPKILSPFDFINMMKNYSNGYLPHHSQYVWQDRVFREMKHKFWQHRGYVLYVVDYAENYHHVALRQYQSAYWVQVMTTVYMLVSFVSLEDYIPLSDAERNELRHLFTEKGVDPVLKITHCFVSEDNLHDSCQVEHCEDLFFSWLNDNVKRPGPQGRDAFFAQRWSDGCAAQLKNCQEFLKCTLNSGNSGVSTRYNYFGSAHGKNECDGEGGALKHSVAEAETLANAAENPDLLIKDPAAVHKYLDSHCRSTKKAFMEKKGVGIFTRIFHLVKKGDVKRKMYHEAKPYEGTMKVHNVISLGQPGRAKVCERSCACDVCMNPDTGVDYSTCRNILYRGVMVEANILAVEPETVYESSGAFVKERGSALGELIQCGMFVAMETDDPLLFFNIGRVTDIAYTVGKKRKVGEGEFRTGDRVFKYDRLLPYGGDSSSLRYDFVSETGEHSGRRNAFCYVENLRIIELVGNLIGDRYTISTECRKLIYDACSE